MQSLTANLVINYCDSCASPNSYTIQHRFLQHAAQGPADGGIDFVQTEQGRALNNGGDYSYQYNLSDHLGNVRYSFDIPDGRWDWVQNKEGEIYWDKNANDQGSTKKDETYLGKDLTFTFDSYINKSFDGPRPIWDPRGVKLRSTITVNSSEDADGNLLAVDVKSNYDVKATADAKIFKGRDYFSGLGKDQNMGTNIANSNGFNATFEQHASVNGLEQIGLHMAGYDVVNVAQKLTMGLSGIIFLSRLQRMFFHQLNCQ